MEFINVTILKFSTIPAQQLIVITKMYTVFNLLDIRNCTYRNNHFFFFLVVNY